MTGDDFRAARNKQGLTQRQLGKILGVTYQTVMRWEKKGNREVLIHPRHWNELAKVLVVPVDLLYFRHPVKPNGSETTNINAKGKATIISASSDSGGRDATHGGDINRHNEFHVSPLERQVLEFNRTYGNEVVLKKMLDGLIDMKDFSEKTFGLESKKKAKKVINKEGEHDHNHGRAKGRVR